MKLGLKKTSLILSGCLALGLCARLFVKHEQIDSSTLVPAPVVSPPAKVDGGPALAAALSPATTDDIGPTAQALTEAEVQDYLEDDAEALRYPQAMFDVGKRVNHQLLPSGRYQDVYENSEGQILTRILEDETVVEETVEQVSGESYTVYRNTQGEDGEVTMITVRRGSLEWSNTYDVFTGKVKHKTVTLPGRSVCVTYLEGTPVGRQAGDCLSQDAPAVQALDSASGQESSSDD